jgi:hypothetical protein
MKEVWKRQQDMEARLTVFDPSGAMVLDTVLSPHP